MARLSILKPLADFYWDDGETTRARGLLKEYHETAQTLGYRFDHGVFDSISEMAAAQGDYVEAVATRQQDYLNYPGKPV